MRFVLAAIVRLRPAVCAANVLRTAAVSSAVRSVACAGHQSTRAFAASARSHADQETTLLKASAGSGRGGAKDKTEARKLKQQQQREKERAKRQRDKERQQQLKLRDKERKLKQKQREQEKKANSPEAVTNAILRHTRLPNKKKGADELAKAKKAAKPRSALHPPKAPVNAWGIFLRDFVKSRKDSLAPGEKLPTVTALTREAAPLYRDLPPSERHELMQRAEEERRAYPAILKEWQATLTPEMIKEENAVRLKRRRLGLSQKKPIKLEGEPKKPMSGYMRFTKEVRAGTAHGDVLRNETNVLEQSKLIAAAWRELSESEREEYHKQYEADKERYVEEKRRFDEELASRTSA
ncbi:hypothetical protein OIV83_002394 [Microbotryomycetes sp. JL201]|nr:hypothetical protein OIV83_002394 [Microbotryomycetes sp. JL201]